MYLDGNAKRRVYLLRHSPSRCLLPTGPYMLLHDEGEEMH